MIASAGMRKILAFGLLGAMGCLLAGGLGVGLLKATEPEKKAAGLLSGMEAGNPTATTPLPPADATAVPESSSVPIPPEMEERLTKAGAGKGEIEIGLIWHNRNDLDLHCVDPRGETILHNHRNSASGGELDVDANVSGDKDDPAEHIRWKKDPPKGEYKVYVNHYKNHARSDKDKDPTTFTVHVKAGGASWLFENQKISFGEPKKPIKTFRWPPPDLRVAAPDVVVHRGGKRSLGIKIARKNLSGPATLTFHSDAPGLAIAQSKWPEDRAEDRVEIVCAPDVEAKRYKMDVTAECDGEKAKATFEVEVRATLAVAASPAVEVYPGGDNKLAVRVNRNGFAGPVGLRLFGETDGLRLGEVSIGSDASEATISLAADKTAVPGERKIELEADGGKGVDVVRTSFRVKVHEPIGFSWLELLRTSGWTGLLAVGLALALVMGQNYFLGKRLLDASAAKILGGALLVGVLAGGLGQILAGGLAGTSLRYAGFLVGWVLLGGLLGRGMAFFIPNLHGWKAAASGAVAGLLGALLFVLTTAPGREWLGQLLGAGLLGFAIGAMVALVEIAFRKAWLEVRYGEREKITVNLGADPVLVGGDGRACAVFARGAPPVALRFWLEGGRVYCEDVPNRRQAEARLDQPLTVGALSLTVRASSAPAPADAPTPPTPAPPRPTVQPSVPQPPPARPAPPPAPAVAVSPPRPVAPSAPTIPASPSAPTIPAGQPQRTREPVPPTPPKPSGMPPQPPAREPVPPTPPKRSGTPATPAAPPPGRRGDNCPVCGTFSPYKPGFRECAACGHEF